MSYLNNDSVAEFCGQIVDGIEDYLSDKKHVTPDMLPNDDRDAAACEGCDEQGQCDGDCEDKNSAIIFGEDYDIIADAVRHELDIYGLIGWDTPCTNKTTVFTVIEHIKDGCLEVISKIKGLTWTDDDASFLENYIKDTFHNWEIFK